MHASWFELHPRLRRVLGSDDISGRGVVLWGPKNKWPQGLKAVAAKGGKAVALHEVAEGGGDETHEGLPVIGGPLPPHLAGVPVVFCAQPKKTWFTAAPPAPQECLWLSIPERRKLVGRHMPDLWKTDSERLSKVMVLLEDELSRSMFQALIKARVLGDTGYHQIAPYVEYHHPIVRGQPEDVVFDVGAYDGDTARMFARAVGPRGRVIALEPSHKNFVGLCDRITREDLTSVLPMCMGAGRKSQVLGFRSDAGASSKISSDGETPVPVIDIDRLVMLLSLPRVDLIKLDVEGAELDVLTGAWDTIRRFRPKLQVSIYHKPTDLFSLPLMLMERLDNYAFFFGHHSFYHVESDLYCVPRERLSAASPPPG